MYKCRVSFSQNDHLYNPGDAVDPQDFDAGTFSRRMEHRFIGPATPEELEAAGFTMRRRMEAVPEIAAPSVPAPVVSAPVADDEIELPGAKG